MCQYRSLRRSKITFCSKVLFTTIRSPLNKYCAVNAASPVQTSPINNSGWRPRTTLLMISPVTLGNTITITVPAAAKNSVRSASPGYRLK